MDYALIPIIVLIILILLFMYVYRRWKDNSTSTHHNHTSNHRSDDINNYKLNIDNTFSETSDINRNQMLLDAIKRSHEYKTDDSVFEDGNTTDANDSYVNTSERKRTICLPIEDYCQEPETIPKQKNTHRKAFILTFIIDLVIIGLIAIFLSTVVFQRTDEIYGLNTPCTLVSTDPSKYHASNCKRLNNEAYETELWILSIAGYKPCPNCIKGRKFSKTCYFTDTGNHFHYWSCHYLNKSSHQTTVIRALSGGFEPCSHCVNDIDDEKMYVIEPLGTYFHEQWCSRSREPKITFSTSNVYKAREDKYTACPKCDVGELDVTYIKTPMENNIVSSILSAIFSSFFLFPFLLLIYNAIKSKVK